MVVQERHLWLNLVEMKDVDKAHFLDAPISQAGLFGDTVEGFAQQFSAVQQQTEAIQHTCPGVMHHLPLPLGPGLSLPVAVGTLLRPPELDMAFALSQETARTAPLLPLVEGREENLPSLFRRWSKGRTAFCTIHPYSLSLHHHRYVDSDVGAACTASGGMAHAAQPVSLGHAHNSTRLRDSVRQATSQVQWRSRDVGGSPECPCLARGDCCPPGKGRK